MFLVQRVEAPEGGKALHDERGVPSETLSPKRGYTLKKKLLKPGLYNNIGTLT
jgi:hypothetical protein